MGCQRFTIKLGLVYCEHYDECHRLKYCLCEVDPDAPPPPPAPKRTHAARLPWPDRRQQILELAKHEIITTTTLMSHTRGSHGTVSRWLDRLIKEGAIKCHSRANKFLGQPAVYVATPPSI